jgi:parallel beta-helix repeat protein
VLDADVGPCEATSPALTVRAAELDLDGFTVSCGDPAGTTAPRGIVLEGGGATLRNGTITGCGTAVVLGEPGQHTVERIHVRDSGNGFVVPKRSRRNRIVANRYEEPSGFGLGFGVEGNRNTLDGNQASGGGEALTSLGFLVRGVRNVLRNNVASSHRNASTCGEGGLGFVIYGKNHTLTANVASGNSSQAQCGAGHPTGSGFVVGFSFAAGEKNTTFGIVLQDNMATGNQNVGFRVDANRATLVGNVAEANGGHGFSGSAMSFERNTARGNGERGAILGGARRVADNVTEDNGGSGLTCACTKASVTGNVAERNRGSGIVVSNLVRLRSKVAANTARNNREHGISLEAARSRSTVEANVATGNGLAGNTYFDLHDAAPECGANVWANNTFGRASQQCIR